MGRVDMGIDWRNMSTTIYERLAQNKIDSVIYYQDSTMASTFDGLAGNPDFFGSFNDDFLPACADNDLPAYSFLEPRFANSAGGNGQPAFSASDQHPDHNVKEGEALIQTVFKAIWGNPKVRNSTLLVIVYDEHGGLYDHVPPPTTVNPDVKVWTNNGISLDPSFDFTRLGVRVPAVLISPYIQPGTIDHRIYDHTSIIATALKLLLPNVASSHLTLRDKIANTFEDNLTLQEPRDEKIDLGAGAKSEPPSPAQLAQPINEHLKAQVQQTAALEQKLLPPNQRSAVDPNAIKTEAQAAAYMQSVYAKIRAQAPGKAGAAGSNN